MPGVTLFPVLVQSETNRLGVLTTPLGRRGLTLLQTPHFLPILLLKRDLLADLGVRRTPCTPPATGQHI